ncbi:hypothetical protein [Chelativorans xinjiangense]|uniref:hypothetical protein n=1 Tax=Chelativorans xinjiangense TaxID=2681485 RepID=UPI001359A7CE|nr:hypothetical protein [Chelativorans xinjiangense]
MSAPSLASIVLFTMQALKNEGSWCGETHVQKALYLCQMLAGVPSDFKFILYKHGPFSFQLSDYLQSLIADEIVQVVSRHPYGPMLCISDEAIDIASEVNSNEKIASGISFVAKNLGSKNVSELEKLATAVFVNNKYGSELSLEKRAEILTSLKSHVQLDAARSAFIDAERLASEAQSVH